MILRGFFIVFLVYFEVVYIIWEGYFLWIRFDSRDKNELNFFELFMSLGYIRNFRVSYILIGCKSLLEKIENYFKLILK